MSKILFSALFLAAFTSLAVAQTPEVGEEIIVTADPLRKPIGEIAQGATTLDRDTVLTILGSGLGETLDGQPGISSSFFGAGSSRPIVRGLGEDRIRILSNGLGQIDVSSISADHAVTAEGLEAERIETLRGAAALAYGGNAVGGVINVMDRRIAEVPAEKPFAFDVYGALASGAQNADAAAHATLALGPLVAHLDGFIRDSSNYEIPGFALSPARRAEELSAGADPESFAKGKQPNSFAEAEAGSFGLSWVGARGHFGASVKRLTSLYGIPEATEEEAGGEEEEAIFAGPRIDLESKRYEVSGALKAPWRGAQSVRLSAAQVDYEHSEIEPSGEIGTVFTNEGYEARLELTHAPILGFDGVIGLTGLSTDFAAIGEEAFITPTQTNDRAVFIVERREFGNWSVEGGLRFEQRDYENAAVGDRDFSTSSQSLGFGFKPAPAWFFGATLARTERAPTETELFSEGAHLATASFEIGDPTLDTEVALSLEGAARWRGERLTLEANIYRVAFEDFIALLADGTQEEGLPVFRFVADDATFTGGELVVGANFFKAPSLRFDGDFALDVVRAELDTAGDAPRIPPLSATLGFELEAGRFGGRVEWVHTQKQDKLATFETPTDGYDLFNARVTFSPVIGDRKLTFLLDARNLTDEEARAHTSFVKEIVARPGRSVRFALTSSF
jgi:iron complex outermembrane receptor protein